MKGASSLHGEGLGSSLQCIVFFSKLFDSIAIKRDASDKVSFCSEGVQSRQMRSMSRVLIYIRHSLSENIFSILCDTRVRLFVFFKLRLRAPRNLEKCFGKWHWQVCITLFFKHLEPCSKLRKILNKYPTLNREIDCLILNLFRFSFVPVL